MADIELDVSGQEELVSRLRTLLSRGNRPVAFITGSGISYGAVAGVQELVGDMRASLQDDGDTVRFDSAVVGPGPGDKYQQAAQFLEDNRGPDDLNRVIRRAVLRACVGLTDGARRSVERADAEPEFTAVELNSALWRLTPGVAALGELLHHLPAHRRGPVITTNFDPLLEVAVRKAGGRANMQYIDLDGKLQRNAYQDGVDIVHVHGFWSRGDTLHTVRQLQAHRPLLHGSLRESLRDHTVVVTGYSGWNDAFSRSLCELVGEQDMKGIDLIWCAFDKKLTESHFSTGLLREIRKAPRRKFYQGIDANDMLPKLLGEYLTAVQSPPGWLRVDRDHLGRVRAEGAAPDTVRAFFDGAQPQWHLAVSPQVPRLSPVAEIVQDVNRCLDGGLDRRMVAAVGPMGEGKSTALMQAAADLAESRADVRVYWRRAGTAIDVETLLAVPEQPGQHILLVSDDGALVIEELRQLMLACRARGRTDVHVLIAAQEREWRFNGGIKQLAEFAKIKHWHGVTDEDGEALVDAWEQLGTLRELARTPRGERARKLVALSAADFGKRPSSLVGAMLKLRYGPLLKQHVGEMLERLAHHPQVGEAALSLRECFLMIALLHATFALGNDKAKPLSERILARAVGMKPAEVEPNIGDPLGKEAVFATHGDDLWVRHHSIAEAALDVSREQSPGEIVTLLSRLVPAAVAHSPAHGTIDPDVYAVAYLSKRIGHAEEAVEAAAAAVAAAPTRLSYRTSQIAALRGAKRTAEALRVAEEVAALLPTITDSESEWGFFLEWGTTAGLAGRDTDNVLLDGLAMHVSRAEREVVSAVISMGEPLKRLHSRGADPVLLDAIRGVIGVAAVRRMNDRYRRYLDRHRTYVTGCGSPEVLEGDAAWAAVQECADRLRPKAGPAVTRVLARLGKSVRPADRLLARD